MRLIKYCFILALISVAANCVGQDNPHNNAFFNDANGKPLKLTVDYRIEGTPYFYEQYCAADLFMANGKKYGNIVIKLNLINNQIIYKAANDEEMETLTPVTRIEFYPYVGKYNRRVTLISFPNALNQPGSVVYELLVDSTAKLMKHIKVTYSDNKGYNEATLTRTYKKAESLYALIPSKGKEPIKIQRNKSSVLEALSDKGNKISAYIEKNELKCKSDADIISVFNYYNSLGK